MDIKIINPIEVPDWNEQILELPGATIFHTANWATVLSQSYGYQPRYFTAFQAGRIIGCIPMMHVNSTITGRRGVSLPFTDECQPLGSPDCVEGLWKSIQKHALNAGWKRIGLRGDCHVCLSVPSSTFKSHYIDINIPIEQLERNLRGSTRRNIKKASRYQLQIDNSETMRAVNSFYRLNCLTRRRHGLPPQPKHFFERVEQHILFPRMGFVLTATFKDIVVASAMFFHFNNLVIYKYAASDMAYQNLRANNLIIWHAIKQCRAAGFKRIYLGRTETKHSGLLQFKRGWRAVEKDLHYYDYNPKENRFVQNNGELKSSYAVFKRMPIPLLKLSSRILYKHVG